MQIKLIAFSKNGDIIIKGTLTGCPHQTQENRKIRQLWRGASLHSLRRRSTVYTKGFHPSPDDSIHDIPPFRKSFPVQAEITWAYRFGQPATFSRCLMTLRSGRVLPLCVGTLCRHLICLHSVFLVFSNAGPSERSLLSALRAGGGG